MAQDFAKWFYDSAKWEGCRKAFIQYRIGIDGGLCTLCQQAPGFIVHHKTKLTADNIGNPDVTLNFDNLDFVCHECHNKIHFADFYNLDCYFVDGQPVPRG